MCLAQGHNTVLPVEIKPRTSRPLHNCTPLLGDVTNYVLEMADHHILDKEVRGLSPLAPGPEVIKLFSCSTQLSIKFQLHINDKIAQRPSFFNLLVYEKFF